MPNSTSTFYKFDGVLEGHYWEAHATKLAQMRNKGILSSRITYLYISPTNVNEAPPLYEYHRLDYEEAYIYGNSQPYLIHKIVEEATRLCLKEETKDLMGKYDSSSRKKTKKEKKQVMAEPIVLNKTHKCDWCSKGPFDRGQMVRVVEVFGSYKDKNREEACYYCSWYCALARMDSLKGTKISYLIQPIDDFDIRDLFMDMREYVNDTSGTSLDNNKEEIEDAQVISLESVDELCDHSFLPGDCPVGGCPNAIRALPTKSNSVCQHGSYPGTCPVSNCENFNVKQYGWVGV